MKIVKIISKILLETYLNLNKINCIFVIAIYKINLLRNQDIYLIKHRCILFEKNLHSQALGSGINPRGVLDFSPINFFSKRKIALQGN